MYDVVIIGGGPAGLSAALYLARAKVKAVLLEKSGYGGQIALTQKVKNYPGIYEISGKDLADSIHEQGERYGGEFSFEVAKEIIDENEKKIVITDKRKIECRAIIIATGAAPKKAGFEGEEEFIGKGVSYCATCDGAFFRNKVTAVVGGGNVALEDAIFLSRMCKKVYLIHRRDEFRGAKILQDEVKKNDKIEILWNTIVTKIDGDEVVEGLHIQDVDNHVDKLLDVDGIFIAVGTKPASELLSGKLSTDEKGYIIAGEDGVTNIPGIFAAGDGRSKNLRQVVTAVSDGANCVYSVERYLQNA